METKSNICFMAPLWPIRSLQQLSMFHSRAWWESSSLIVTPLLVTIALTNYCLMFPLSISASFPKITLHFQVLKIQACGSMQWFLAPTRYHFFVLHRQYWLDYALGRPRCWCTLIIGNGVPKRSSAITCDPEYSQWSSWRISSISVTSCLPLYH